ncbi:ATP synthase protein I [Arboricoccus pini]|uniref:ATP synthase protein I n=2 Tax=Arboricoccus pini TaxID=1963835 RepID=A0A212Q584_9PROT|nr:ATP synthase protein I [Arboricoccus pini]
MTGNDKPPSFDDFDARLAKMNKGPDARKGSGSGAKNSGWGQGLQAGIEILTGVGVGALIGYGLDSWFGTRPWLSIVLFVLGGAAGLLNAYRHLQQTANTKDEP